MKGKSITYEDIMKQLTHDYDIEKVILYSLIEFPDNRKYISRISADDFYNEEYKKLFNHIVELTRSDQKFDMYTLRTATELKTAFSLMDMHILQSLFDQYLQKLKEVSAVRQLEMAARSIDIKIGEKRKAADIRKWVLDNVAEIKDTAGNTISAQQQEIDDRFMEYIETDTSGIIRTGFSKLDRVIGGLFGGAFVAIGGLPKTGKTTMMINMVRNACMQGKRYCWYRLR